MRLSGFVFDGLVQDRNNSFTNALELRQSSTNPSTCLLKADQDS